MRRESSLEIDCSKTCDIQCAKIVIIFKTFGELVTKRVLLTKKSLVMKAYLSSYYVIIDNNIKYAKRNLNSK